MCWDVNAKCGLGEGPWAGDRLRITTFENMEALEGPGEWENIGDEDCQLWEDVRAFLKKRYSQDGKTWQENYERVAYAYTGYW